MHNKPNLLVDIQAKLHPGKGAGYERWAKVFNLKQMAQTVNYLTEHGLLEYAQLSEKSSAATARYNELLTVKANVDRLMGYRMETIHSELKNAPASLDGLTAVVGRGGGLMAVEGGVYEIIDILVDHARRGANGVQHPAQLGPQFAKAFSDELRCRAFVVNPPDTDELEPLSRMTGVKGMYRNVHLHALNQKGNRDPPREINE